MILVQVRNGHAAALGPEAHARRPAHAGAASNNQANLVGEACYRPGMLFQVRAGCARVLALAVRTA